MKQEYRWNVADNAAGFDAAAESIHPFYVEIQDRILELLPFEPNDEFCVLDAGGGSGRLVDRLLTKFPKASALVLDQSDAFLDIARSRLTQFGDRARCVQGRLQEDWSLKCPQPLHAIITMSAIHHLDAQEKDVFYGRCYEALTPGGILLNGDEVRPAHDRDYLEECKKWVAHKRRIMDAGLVSPAVCDLLKRWEQRNVAGFGQPRASGDDCHETIEAQLSCFRDKGFSLSDCPWQKDMWAILRGVRPPAC